MGNCLAMAMQEKAIKVMKPDGKVLEYKAPIKVHQMLSEFSGHTVSDTLSAVRHLRQDTQMVGGHLYYLLPLPPPPPQPTAVEKKRVRFANPEREGGVVRIKVVISKQKLEEMLRKGGVSLDDILSELLHQNKGSVNKFHGHESNGSSEGRKPMLESIPEVI